MGYVPCFVSTNSSTLSAPRKETERAQRMGVAGFHWKHSQMMPDCVWHHLRLSLRVMMKICTYHESPWFALLLAPQKQPHSFLTVFLKKIHLFLIILIMASEHFGDLPFPVTSSSSLRSYFLWLSIFFPIVFCSSRISVSEFPPFIRESLLVPIACSLNVGLTQGFCSPSPLHSFHCTAYHFLDPQGLFHHIENNTNPSAGPNVTFFIIPLVTL